jgi:hypothetical protein
MYNICTNVNDWISFSYAATVRDWPASVKTAAQQPLSIRALK